MGKNQVYLNLEMKFEFLEKFNGDSASSLMLNEKEAALALGISEKRLRALVSAKVIPHSFIIGKSVRVRRSSLLSLLSEGKL